MKVSGITVKSGDLVLFDGYSNISKAVKFFTNGLFSHVGILWQCPKTNVMYVWENGDNGAKERPIIKTKDSEDNSAHLTPLQVKLDHYKGDIYIKSLNSNVDQTKIQIELTKFIRKNIGKPYRVDIVPCWNQIYRISVIPLKFIEDNDEDPSAWLCSELVVKTYEHLGLLKMRRNTMAHSVYPDDFIKTKRFKWIKNCKFHQLECLSIKPPPQ